MITAEKREREMSEREWWEKRERIRKKRKERDQIERQNYITCSWCLMREWRCCSRTTIVCLHFGESAVVEADVSTRTGENLVVQSFSGTVGRRSAFVITSFLRAFGMRLVSVCFWCLSIWHNVALHDRDRLSFAITVTCEIIKLENFGSNEVNVLRFLSFVETNLCRERSFVLLFKSLVQRYSCCLAAWEWKKHFLSRLSMFGL